MATTQSSTDASNTSPSESVGAATADTSTIELPTDGWERIATKDDLQAIEARLQHSIAAGLSQLSAELTRGLTKNSVGIAEVQTRLTKGFSETDTRITKNSVGITEVGTKLTMGLSETNNKLTKGLADASMELTKGLAGASMERAKDFYSTTSHHLVTVAITCWAVLLIGVVAFVATRA